MKLKLYAIRDRLVDYFMQPFIAPSDEQVLASVAQLINGKDPHVIKDAAHHFEIWRLAEVDEKTGQVGGDREFLCDCASLIRGDIWKGRITATDEVPSSNGGQRGQAPTSPRPADPGQRAPTGATQAEDRQGTETNPGPG